MNPYRKVKGAGRFGAASGGFNGDGDVFMVATDTAAREKAAGWFHSMLSDEGKLVKGQYLTSTLARELRASVNDQIQAWRGLDYGDAVEVAVEIPNLTTLRVALFKCFLGPDPNLKESTNGWWIPPVIKLPPSQSRKVEVTEAPAKGRRR